MVCINNTVCDVLSSHPHHQPLPEAVAPFLTAGKEPRRQQRLVFALGPSPGPYGAHEAHLLAVRHQHGHTKIWGFEVFVFVFNHVELILGGL